MRTLVLGLLMLLLIGDGSWAAGIDTLVVKDDTILYLKTADGKMSDSFQAVSPSGKTILWDEQFATQGSTDLHGLTFIGGVKFNMPLQTKASLPFLSAGLECCILPSSNLRGELPYMASYKCGWQSIGNRWSASFSSDETMVVYPSGVKLLAVALADGKTTELVATSTKDDDANMRILSEDMHPDGSKCVYVVGHPIPELMTPEMYVYMAKAKKSIKITQASGVGALWTADGKSIIFERMGKREHYGEVWMLDSTMKLTRLPVGGIGVTGGQEFDKPSYGFSSDNERNKFCSHEAQSPEEGPGNYAVGYFTGDTHLKVVGDTLLVIRTFIDGETSKQWFGKSYAFVVDLRTLTTMRIDCLPKQIFRIAAMDVIAPGLLAVYALGTDDTSGIYAVDLATKQTKLLRAVDGRPQTLQMLQPNLVVRSGSIYTVSGTEIHKLSLGHEAGSSQAIIGKANEPSTEKNDPADRRYTLPGKAVDSDNPEVVALANKLTSGRRTNLEKALSIHDWVAANISYDTGKWVYGAGADYYTASEALHLRKGVCAHYALLTAALCRAAGLPAKVVVGDAILPEVIYTPMWLKIGMGKHAWNEVMIDGKWIVIDATWDGTTRDKLEGNGQRKIRESVGHEYFNPDPYQFARDHRKAYDEKE